MTGHFGVVSGLRTLGRTLKPRSVPSWYVSPEQQHTAVGELNRHNPSWGFEPSNLPPIPKGFRLRDGEVLLLCVYLPEIGETPGLSRTFSELWRLVIAPDGYRKWSPDGLKNNSEHLRSIPEHEHRPGIRWVAFNPTAYFGKSPRDARRCWRADNVRLAGVEVFMAMVLFPDWAASWDGDSSPYPNMSGLEHCWHPNEEARYRWHAPYMRRWDRHSRVLALCAGAGDPRPYWSSPTVRE